MASPYVGEIRMVGFNFAPVSWSFCNGALLPISQYDVLYSLIGTTYGGDGVNTFALPNLLGRSPVHFGTLSGGGTYTIGQVTGQETVTLLANQLPQHNHMVQCNGAGPTGATSASATNNYWADSTALGGELYFSTLGTDPMAPNSLQPSGGGQPHDNMAPFQAINYIISLFGIYPSKP